MKTRWGYAVRGRGFASGLRRRLGTVPSDTGRMAHHPGSPSAPRRSMLKTWLIAFASLLIDLLLGIDAWSAREAALDQAMRSVGGLSLSAKEHASRSFADIDHVLASLAETLAARMAETADGRLAPGDPELTRLLLRRLAELDNVRAITVINEIGIQTINSRIDPPAGIDLHNRGYFIAQRTAAGDAIYLDRPAISRVDGRPFIGASRRINRPGGGELRRRRECGRRPRSVPRILCLSRRRRRSIAGVGPQ